MDENEIKTNLDNSTLIDVIRQLRSMSTDDLRVLYAGYKHTPAYMLSASPGLYNIITLLSIELEYRD